MIRPKVVWPFPETRIRELSSRVKAFVVAELNYGQMFLEVERAVAVRCDVHLIGHGGGTVHEPELWYEEGVMLHFWLPRGCYATTLLGEIMKVPLDSDED